MNKRVILILIFILAATLRLYNINWDQGFHLHPDERAIVIFTLPIALPSNLAEFFHTTSPLNPHFFAYGNFPLYFLKIAGSAAGTLNPYFSGYNGINILGRFLSVIFELLTIFLLYKLAKKLFTENVALLSSFFYAVSVLAVQSAHFYIVDIPLTFFIIALLYVLIAFYEKPDFKKGVLIGIIFGLSLATKTSASVLLLSIGASLTIDFILIFLKSPHRPHVWLPHLPRTVKNLILYTLAIIPSTIITFIIFEPYALIDKQNFIRQTFEQYQMTHNAFVFPYTLQYVGKTPFIYEVKNIFFWGQGPILSILSLAGAFYFTYIALKKEKKQKWAQEAIIAIFFWVYFFVVGKFAIGFMRYLLPVYPLLCLFAGLLSYKIINALIKFKLNRNIIFYLLFTILFLIWPLSFLKIYSLPNTRVLASNWINNNIPYGANIAIEHWDDSLPLFGQEKYHILTLELYNPDTPVKWQRINQQLSQADYIIIASNRLYVPLQKLTDCQKLPHFYCYKQTANYYKKLFSGELGFQKVAEFSVYPTIPILNIPINDQSADESFTVYDHPKIMIFKKNFMR